MQNYLNIPSHARWYCSTNRHARTEVLSSNNKQISDARNVFEVEKLYYVSNTQRIKLVRASTMRWFC